MTRESEVAAYLRADTELTTLAPGRVYADSDLDERGIADAIATPTVWTGGQFQTTIVVRQRAKVPTGDLQSTQSQRTSMSQVVEVWAYGTTADAIEAALDRAYALMMGKRFSRAFSATWVGSGVGIGQAPELPSGIKAGRNDYRIVSIRVPSGA